MVCERLQTLNSWKNVNLTDLKQFLEDIVTEYDESGYNFNASGESSALIRELCKRSHLHDKLDAIHAYIVASKNDVPLNQGKKLFRIIMQKLASFTHEEVLMPEQKPNYDCPIGGANKCIQDPIWIEAKRVDDAGETKRILVDRHNLFICQHRFYGKKTPTFISEEVEYLVPLPRHSCSSWSPIQQLHHNFPDFTLKRNNGKRDTGEAYSYKTDKNIIEMMDRASVCCIKSARGLSRLEQSWQWLCNNVAALFGRRAIQEQLNPAARYAIDLCENINDDLDCLYRS